MSQCSKCKAACSCKHRRSSGHRSCRILRQTDYGWNSLRRWDRGACWDLYKNIRFRWGQVGTCMWVTSPLKSRDKTEDRLMKNMPNTHTVVIIQTVMENKTLRKLHWCTTMYTVRCLGKRKGAEGLKHNPTHPYAKPGGKKTREGCVTPWTAPVSKAERRSRSALHKFLSFKPSLNSAALTRLWEYECVAWLWM